MIPQLPWAFQAVSALPLSASGLSNEGSSAICVWYPGAGDGYRVCAVTPSFYVAVQDVYLVRLTATSGDAHHAGGIREPLGSSLQCVCFLLGSNEAHLLGWNRCFPLTTSKGPMGDGRTSA